MQIIPAILSRDIVDFEEKLALATSLSTEVQIDVIDGQFAPHPTIQLADIAGLPKGVVYEAHLMVVDPLRYLPDIVRLGIERVALHAEIEWDLSGIIRKYQEEKIFVLVALNPNTSIEQVREVALVADGVLIMSVTPGESAQAFLPEVLHKVALLRHIDPAMYIEIDGGINRVTIKDVAADGIDAAIVGSAIMSADDPNEAYQELAGIASGSR